MTSVSITREELARLLRIERAAIALVAAKSLPGPDDEFEYWVLCEAVENVPDGSIDQIREMVDDGFNGRDVANMLVRHGPTHL